MSHESPEELDISKLIDNYLLNHFDDIPEDQKDEIIQSLKDPTPLESDLVVDLEEEKSRNLSVVIGDMKLGKKIKLGMLGNMAARSILIKENSRQIRQAVMSNPRITESEVLDFAKNSNLDKQVFSMIGNDNNWMKSYSIKCAIVSNPKTPMEISIRWIKYLKDKELKQFSKSKNIPSALATQMKKLVEIRDKKPSG